MIKKVLTPATIAVFFWGIGSLLLNVYYYEYLRPYMYISLAVIFPIMVWNLIKQRKEDKNQGTEEFKHSISRMVIMAMIMIIIFCITKQNHI